MIRIIGNPDPDLRGKWGPLAYVSEVERQRILALPSGMFKPEIKRLEKEIGDMKKRAKEQNQYKLMRKKPL